MRATTPKARRKGAAVETRTSTHAAGSGEAVTKSKRALQAEVRTRFLTAPNPSRVLQVLRSAGKRAAVARRQSNEPRGLTKQEARTDVVGLARLIDRAVARVGVARVDAAMAAILLAPRRASPRARKAGAR